MRRLISLALLAVLAAGCAGSLSPGEDVAATGANAVKYVHDEVHAVGCWYLVGTSGAGSISCLPDSEYRP